MDGRQTTDDRVSEALEDHIVELMVLGTNPFRQMPLTGLRCHAARGWGGCVGGRAVALLDTQGVLCAVLVFWVEIHLPAWCLVM